MRCHSALVFSAPLAADFGDGLGAIWVLSTFTVVSPYLVEVLKSVFFSIVSAACFALVEVSVRHLGVFVKLAQHLFLFTPDATF